VSVLLAVLAVEAVALVVSLPASAVSARVGLPSAAVTVHPYNVFWDQNEEEDSLQMPSGTTGQLIAPWDPNGQLCVVPGGGGRFVVGYNPTLASQNNPGSLKPVKQPPVGEAMYDVHGDFTGQTISVPGPYALPGQSVGGDIPPDTAGGGAFNNNGTMTGCAFDRRGDLFATDLGTAQGQFPPPDDGRLIEWFAPSYQSFCVVYGPTAGGVGPHHVDGTGGLLQPGDLALDPKTGDLMVPEAGSPAGGIGGSVLRIARRSFPSSAADCGPAGLYPRSRLQVSTFVQGNATFLPFPQSIARDPTCNCWAVATVIGNPSIVWLHDNGTPVAGRSIPGEDIAHVGQDPNGWNPFGSAFAPDGTLYFVDIHIECTAPLVNCGPGYKAGRLMRVTFQQGHPSPPTVVATGDDFPTSVTVCQTDVQACPQPGSTSTIGPGDWRGYGHDPQHTFAGSTTLTAADVRKLKPAWVFPTHLAVTATPTVVDGVVYVGAWDGYFYALDLRTGSLRWKFQLDSQPGVTPPPGGPPDPSTDGGIVTSSAWFEPTDGQHPDLVIFGGGFTLYALNAHTGGLVWKQAFTGRPDLPTDPTTDQARIFSSPVVVDGKVLFGVSPDGQAGHRGYIEAAEVETGAPLWTFDTDVDTAGNLLNDGCGGVWSSGTVLPAAGLVVFGVSDCNFFKTGPYSESVVALNITNGSLAWVYQPPRADDGCDFDFGATPNSGLAPNGDATFLGIGGKDGTYYSLDPASGQLRWSTNVVFGGAAGGFIGTTAFDGSRVYGSTGIGDFGHGALCDPSNPNDVEFQEPTAHSFDANTGAVVWQAQKSASFGSTTVAGGMTFTCVVLATTVNVRATGTGALLARLGLPSPCWSGIATAGNALVLGLGTSATADGSGVVALTPGGAPPEVPAG
jgi:polyvinyl alcohol dehydrogenase (cytochrome)